MAALINDSVGTLAGGCYVDADTKIGVILGTGTNACYVEQSSNISALASSNGCGQQRPFMAVNTEWGNFDASSSPRTDVSPHIPALFSVHATHRLQCQSLLRDLTPCNAHQRLLLSFHPCPHPSLDRWIAVQTAAQARTSLTVCHNKSPYGVHVVMLHPAFLCPGQGAQAASSISRSVCRSIGNWMQTHPMQGSTALRRWSQECTWERLRGEPSSSLRCVSLSPATPCVPPAPT